MIKSKIKLINDAIVDSNVESNSEDDGIVIKPAHVSYQDAINAANVLIQWTEQNTDLTAKHMSHMLQVRSDIVKTTILKPAKQTKLTDYFKKTIFK